MKTIVVIGAGLGGLVTAGLLAKRGFKVTLLERSSIIGGRSHVLTKDGFTMSYGAHALLAPKVEPMKSIIKELGLNLPYRNPQVSKFMLYSQSKVISNPLGTGAFSSPAISGLKNRFDLFKKFFQLMRSQPHFDPNLSVEQWIQQNAADPSVAKVLRAYSVLSLYDGALDHVSMNSFVEHTRSLYSTTQPIVYIGYDVLLNELVRSFRKNGGDLRLNSEVTQLVMEEGRITGVRFTDETILADDVILDLPPKAIQKLIADGPLSTEMESYLNQSANYCYVYDVLLSKRIRSDVANLLDLDNGVYINDFSLNSLGSAPEGGQMLNCLRFLKSIEQENDAHAESSQAAVEKILDHVYSGWRQHIVGHRIINRAMVNGIARRIGNECLPLASPAVQSLYFVGDSTIGKGALGVPCYDSAWKVATMISDLERK
jgi:phytoene dehydrogenase-like protein